MQARATHQSSKSKYKICAHILRELNMQEHHAELVHICWMNWICRHNRRGRDKDRDQGHPEARASPEKVKIEIEKTSIIQRHKPLEKFEVRAPNGHHRYIYPFKLIIAPCLFGWWLRLLAFFILFYFILFFFKWLRTHSPFAYNWRNRFRDSEPVVAYFLSSKGWNSNIWIPRDSAELYLANVCVLYAMCVG